MGKREVVAELARRQLIKRHQKQRDSLIEFIIYMWAVYKGGEKLKIPKFYYEIEEKLMQMMRGECTRLIINIPPRSGKTMFITQMFPIWVLGKHPEMEFISAGHSTNLTRSFSQVARDLYQSPEFRQIFPEAPPLRDDLNTAEWWKNEKGGGYYAAGIQSKFSGKGANIFIIDDIVDPQDAEHSEVKLAFGNQWYTNTVEQRLNHPELEDGTIRKGAVLIIMQRVHDNDICGMLEEEERQGRDNWDRIVIPALTWDEEGKPVSFFPERENFSVENLLRLQKRDPVVFSTQLQQEPTNKEAQEFHEEFWKYHTELPKGYKQWFAMLDPAFSEKKSSDNTVYIVACVCEGKMYVEEMLVGQFNTYQTEDKAVYLANKYDLEKMWGEDYAAQVTIVNNITRRFDKEGISTPFEGFNQKGTNKNDKIRSIISPLRNGLISFKKDMPHLNTLENEMKRFPRGAHDDACFLGSTLVSTDRGEIRIDSVVAGDVVITPFGNSKVTSAGCTGVKGVKDYGIFTSTPSHKICNDNRFDTIDSCHKDIYTIAINNTIVWKLLRLLYLKTLNIDSWERGDITYLNQQLKKEGAMLKDFMLLYGKATTKRPFLRVVLYIMLMAIVSITVLRTLKYVTGLNINQSTLQNGIRKTKSYLTAILTRLDTSLKNGMGQMTVKNGTKTITQSHSEVLRNTTISAITVEKTINQQERKHLNIVQISVELISTTINYLSLRIVICVIRSLLTITGEQEHVQQSAKLGKCTKQKVYNLETDSGMFFANGYLVSNCDCLQMLFNAVDLRHDEYEEYENEELETDDFGRPIY